MKSNLGLKIEALQIENNISNQQLAKRMSKKPQNIAKLKTVNKPRIGTLYKLAKAFNVSASYFL